MRFAHTNVRTNEHSAPLIIERHGESVKEAAAEEPVVRAPTAKVEFEQRDHGLLNSDRPDDECGRARR